MRDVIIRLSLSEEEAEQFEGVTAMIVPLSDAEIVRLRETVNGVDDFLRYNQKCLSTLKQVLETRGSDEPDIAKTLDMQLEPARVAVELQDAARQLLGRALFVSPGQKERLQ